jgi:hypothetical protein
MLRLDTRADLQRLIDDEIQESLTLDYKASPSLAKDSRSRDELCIALRERLAPFKRLREQRLAAKQAAQIRSTDPPK